MNIEEFQSYCLSKKGVTEEFPFDQYTLVYKVMGKIFTICGLDSPEFHVALKADPDYAIELREQYQEVQPGFHLNKTHWNTVNFEGSLKDDFLKQLIDHSYTQVIKGMTKKLRTEWENLKGNTNI